MFPLRLGLDALAAALLVAGMAYWWLGNLAHEVIGTAMFALILLHNVFNRRVWRRAAEGRYDARRLANATIIAAMAAAMLGLLATSVVLSRDLLGWTAGNVSFARQLHGLAAYWALILVGLHLGARWTLAMTHVRGVLRLRPSRWRAWALRLIAAGVALHGVGAFTEMAFADKLLMVPALDLWDFNEAALMFLVNHLSVMTLAGVIAHYGMQMLRTRSMPAFSSAY